MRTPDFFLVGAPKCGTTLLTRFLHSHPGIFIPERKESHYFGKDLVNPHYYWIKDKNKYLSLFHEAKVGQILGESSVFYLYSQFAHLEIKELCPTAKIIVMVRNPIDMLYSLHSELLYSGADKLTNFENAVIQGKNRELVFPGFSYATAVKFAEHITKYIKLFTCDNVHIIFHDDLRKDPVTVGVNLCRFLGVSTFQADTRQLTSTVNPNKVVISKILRDFLYQPPKPVRQLIDNIPLAAKATHYLIYKNTRYTTRPPLDRTLRTRLQVALAPNIMELEKITGRNLNDWLS